jgi:hypothetical protein
MSGGSGGGHIIIDSVRSGLSNPLVSANLPAKMRAAVDAILAKDNADWTAADKTAIGHATTWALCNLV